MDMGEEFVLLLIYRHGRGVCTSTHIWTWERSLYFYSYIDMGEEFVLLLIYGHGRGVCTSTHI